MFLLVIIITSTVGLWAESSILHGERAYETLSECMHAGKVTSEWLNQDNQIVKFRCVEKNGEK